MPNSNLPGIGMRPAGVHPAKPAAANYRPDLDGVRAVAVWSVVFYHLSKTTVPGGFLGVDIFFVLSGFLITSILWRESLQGKFSIVAFYDRRIRRIMPALLTCLTVTSVAATAILLPGDLIGYGKSLLASLGFVANIYFWRDTNYFAAAAEMKPLLHLWSLGIEEQFYILFPWMVAGLALFWRRATLAVIVGIVAISLAADFLLRLHGGEGPAFFLLPTRGWELGIGAVLAVLPSDIRVRPWISELAAWFGGLLILLALFIPIPPSIGAPPALPATIGTGLIIFAGARGERPFVNRILELPPMVFFGLISYSLYLWHWPVIVLGQYYLVRDFNVLEMAAALLLMVGCAYGSWRYIERPFRDKSTPIVRVRWAAAAGAGVMALFGVVLLATQGLPGRLSGQAVTLNAAVDTHYRCAVSDLLSFGASRACEMNLPTRDPNDADVVLLGNSHAQMYAPVIKEFLVARGQTGLLVPLNGCLPTVQANLDASCIEMATKNLNSIQKLRRAKTIIVATTWEHGRDELKGPDDKVVDNRNNRALVAALDDLFARLRVNGRRIVLVGPIAVPGWNVASVLSRDLAFGHPVTQPLFQPARDFYGVYGAAIDHFSAERNLDFVRPDLVQCRNGRCEYVLDGHSLFSDHSHIAKRELFRFRAQFEKVFPERPKQTTNQ